MDQISGMVQELLKKPPVVLRVLQWLACIVVFASISHKCRPHVCTEPFFTDQIELVNCTATADYCVYNGGGACSYSISIGVMSFLVSLGFLATEMFGFSQSFNQRLITLGDLGMSTMLTALWFLAFFWLALGWIKEPHEFAVRVVNNAQSAILFALASLGLWAYGAYVTYVSINDGGDSVISGYSPFGGGDERAAPTGSSAYSSYQPVGSHDPSQVVTPQVDQFPENVTFNPQTYCVSENAYGNDSYQASTADA